jgi:cell division protein FtsN
MLWLALVLALPGGAQNAPANKPVSIPGLWSAQMPSASDPSNVQDPIQEAKWQRGLNAERQRLMVSDTNKLLKLASELNAEIRNSNSDSLTPEQLRKVGEIEKLAHSVKEKMSTSIQGTPVFLGPPLPQMR